VLLAEPQEVRAGEQSEAQAEPEQRVLLAELSVEPERMLVLLEPSLLLLPRGYQTQSWLLQSR
jgi:hypothetical protein